MRARQRGERTGGSDDGVDTVTLYPRAGTQVVVHQIAGLLDARAEIARWPFPARQTVRESLAGSAQKRLKLFGRQRRFQLAHKFAQEREVRLGQELSRLWRQLEDIRRPGGSSSRAGTNDDAIALHRRELNADGASADSQARRELVSGRTSGFKHFNDSAARGVQESPSQQIAHSRVNVFRLDVQLPHLKSVHVARHARGFSMAAVRRPQASTLLR